MKCKEHPRYAALRMPMKTMRYPDGCPTCWGVWEGAKTDPKRRAKVVNVELSPEEARTYVLALKTFLDVAVAATVPEQDLSGSKRRGRGARRSPAGDAVVKVSHVLRPLYVMLARATREAQ